jgi:alpha-D-ribose 1-methylphosphonate 5-triphosphate synthase subunit PhnH
MNQAPAHQTASAAPAWNGPLAPGEEAPNRQARCGLEQALSRPGWVVVLKAAQGDTAAPLPLQPATQALLEVLLEGAPRLWLSPALDGRTTRAWLALHGAAQLAVDRSAASLVLVRAADAQPELWHAGAGLGTGAATLLIEVPQLLADPPPPRQEPGDMDLTPRLRLRSGSSPQESRLAVGGLGRHFWRARARWQAEHAAPGADLLLICGQRVAAIPGSAQVWLDD